MYECMNSTQFSVKNRWVTMVISILFYSTDSGWDNPFRPDGDLSREADEIVNMIKGENYVIFGVK